MEEKEPHKKAFEKLLIIIDELREKCPWDKEQTFETLRHLTIEETYELSEAILSNDTEQIKKELGDLLLHIVFYAKIASETKTFDIVDVCNIVCNKLVYRHPHIYGDTNASNSEEVKQNWEKIKLKEGAKSVLEGVPKSLPALIKSMRIQEKAAGVGFDFQKTDQVLEKIQEEIEELREEIRLGNKEKIEEEFGDLLFSMVNYARFLNVSPEDALELTNKKFIKRFIYLEEKAKEKGKTVFEMSFSEMDFFWEEAKKLFNSGV